MTGIYARVLRFRAAIIVISAVIMVAALALIRQTPVNLLPNLAPTTVEVQTEALGLSAQEVEAMITVPLEADMLNGVPWLEKIDSRSITGLSSIEMHFEPGTDLMVARQMVQERLTAAHALPNVSQPPQMRQPVATDARASQFGLTSDSLSLIDLSVLARWTIRPRLMGVPGVANISIWGERARQMQVLVEPERLAGSGVKLEDIVRTAGNSLWVSPLSYLNASTPGTGGFIDTPNQRLGIQHVLPITEADDMRALALTGDSGFMLGDVADVVEGHQPLIGDALINGKPGLFLVVEKFPWADTASVQADIRQALAGMAPGLNGVEIHTDLSNAGAIADDAASGFRLLALIGLILAIVMVLMMTVNWKLATLTAFTGSVAGLGTAGIIFYWGGPVDGVLLGGICVAAAIIIGDAFAAAWAAMRSREADAETTASYATRRKPMIAALISAAVMAVPLLFLDGIDGVIARSMAIPFIIAAGLALAASIFVVPSLHRMLKVAPGRMSGQALVHHLPHFERHLPRSAALGLLGVLALGGLMVLGFGARDAAPTFDTRDLLVEWTSPPGTSIEAVMAQGQAASDILLADDQIASVAVQVGRAEISDEVLNANAGTLWITLAPEASTAGAKQRVLELIQGVGLNGVAMSYQNRQIARSELNPDREDLRVRVYGHEYDKLQTKANELAGRLLEQDNVQSARLILPEQEPVIEIKIDLEKARLLGIKPGDVRRAVAVVMAGLEVGSLFEDQKVFDVVVWGQQNVRSSLDTVESVMIDVPSGQVPLSEMAEVRLQDTPSFINRSSVSRYIDVALTASGVNAATVLEIEAMLAATEFPLEYHAEVVSGSALENGTGGGLSLWQVTLAAIVFVGLLMQSALGSWSHAAIAVGYAVGVAGTAVITAYLFGMWSAAALVGAVVVFAIGLRDAGAMLSRSDADGAPGQIVTGNAAAIAFLLPILIIGGIGFEFTQFAVLPLMVGLVVSSIGALTLLPVFAGGYGQSADTHLDMRGLGHA